VNESSQQGSEQAIRLVRVALLVGISYLLFATFRPFFSALTWAGVLCYALYPLYQRLVRVTRGRQTLSAVLMSLAMTVGLILPLVALSFLIGKELARTSLTLVASLQEEPGLLERWRGYPAIAAVVDPLLEFQRVTGVDIRALLVGNLTELGKALVERLTQVASNVLRGLVELGLILLSAFYFFRDGETLLTWVQEVVPIPTERQRLVIRRFGEVVSGAVYGNTLVAGLEGAIAGIAFWVVGLPAALLWGSVMAILAYLPVLGATLVWVPAALYLFVQGAYLKAVVLCLAGLVIAVLDYVVRNIVVGGASKMHTLLAFFGVLGGIQLFGLVGIVAGPLVVAVAVTLLDSYRAEKAAFVITRTER
jgi:predicted PurR-regulated permease PerM